MKVRFRTNLALLSVAAAMALAGAFLVSFGGTRLSRGELILQYPLWPAFILAMGICGVTLILAKGKALPPFIDGRIVGTLAFAPLGVAAAVATYFRNGHALSFLLLALPVAMYALWTEEPDPKAATHDLNDFLGAASLFLFGTLGYLFPMPEPFMPAPAALAVALAVAPAAAYLAWREPFGKRGAVARTVLGAVITAIAALAYAGEQPVFAILYAPMGILLLLQPRLDSVRMGAPQEQGLTEENVVVDSFERMAEMTAWAVWIFTLIHALFNPPGVSVALFALFVLAFLVFTVEYQLIPARHSTYVSTQRKSVANAILLGIISHLTGGFQSPYAWFFILVLTSGAFVPDPKLILRRLGVIAGYYVVEAAYSWRYGLLNESILVDHLMVQVFVVGLAGVYAYRIAMRRRQIDENLMSANTNLKRALDGERAAKEQLERQSADIALSKQRYEAMLASLADAVVGFDAKGSIDAINPAAEGLLGISFEEARGRRLRDLVPLRSETSANFRLGDYLDTALNGNAIPLPDDVYLERPNGRVYLTGVALPVFDAARRVAGMVVTLSDVTYTREVDQMKTGFLSVAAHQLRTPLSTIRWYLELLNDPGEGKLKKNQKMFAENAYLSLRKMVGLVNRLLAVTRLESGRVPFRPEPTDLKSMTKDILESLKPKLEERRLEIRLDLPDLPAVPLDPTLAREVFINLIENAIRYTPDGGKISIEARDEGDRLSWAIKDDGIGIPQAQQGRIFEKFFRAGNAVEHSSEGSGLGLYLAKFIVSAWGGGIGFVSGEGKGAEFRVTIPKAGMRSKQGQVSLNA